jgi:hypothetical protein
MIFVSVYPFFRNTVVAAAWILAFSSAFLRSFVITKESPFVFPVVIKAQIGGVCQLRFTAILQGNFVRNAQIRLQFPKTMV